MLFVPMTTTDQWKTELAGRWRTSSDFPPEIAERLATSHSPTFSSSSR